MTTTPKRLYGPTALTTSAATKYTSPATGAQIKHIRVDNPQGGSARAFTLSIGADAAGTRLYDGLTVPPGGIDLWGPFTLGNAEIVQALADNAALVLTIDGVEYS